MLSYQEFMAAGNVTCFHSGNENAGHRTLARAFKRQRIDQSAERMEALKKMLSESKTGRQTLEFLEEKGSKMIFEKMKYYGYFSPDKNIVALNPRMSNEDLAVTMVHEIRHAWQDSQMQATDPKMTPKAFLTSGFAIEADACAAEVTYAHEMREKNPKIWDAHQKSGYAPMSTAFEKTFNETGSVEQARADALMTWYKLPVKASYEKSYVQFMGYIARALKKQKEMEPEYFSKNTSAKKMGNAFCKDYDGKPFMTDPKPLEAPENLSLKEEHAKKLAKALIPYMAKYDRSAEKLGLDKVAVVRPNGEKTTGALIIQQVKDEQKLTAALKKMQNGATR